MDPDGLDGLEVDVVGHIEAWIRIKVEEGKTPCFEQMVKEILY